MKKLFALLTLCIFLSNPLFSQKEFKKETIIDFQKSTQDSIFIQKHSDLPFSIENVDLGYGFDTSINQFHRDLLNGILGLVYGPYTSDTSIFYIKLISADTAYKARVGNIWINIKKGRDIALESANNILKDAQAGKDFDMLCKLYSDDKNKATNCDLGWTYNTNFVETFKTEITKHKKGEVYMAETSFGFHIIKSLENPYKERKSVNYVSLTHLKKR